MYKLISIVGLLFFIFILWVICLANTGINSVFFDFIKTIPFGDKIGHFILFGTLTFLCIILLKFRSFQFFRIKIYHRVLFVTVFVLIEELSQNYISTHTFDLIDLSADFLGIITATIGIQLIKSKFAQ